MLRFRDSGAASEGGLSSYLPTQQTRNIRVLRVPFWSLSHDFPMIPAGPRNATALAMNGIGQRFVYILRSERDPGRQYVGRTANVGERLRWHDEGPSGHTLHHRHWRILVILEFPDGSSAARFERYLKSGSGRAFPKRHFAPACDKVTGPGMRP